MSIISKIGVHDKFLSSLITLIFWKSKTQQNQLFGETEKS